MPSQRAGPSWSGKTSISSSSTTRWRRERASRARPIALRSWGVTEASRPFRSRTSAAWPRRFSTPSRATLGDERLRYLRQQMELGGAEIILSAGRSATAAATGGEPLVPTDGQEGSMGSKGRAQKSGTEKWRKGAPAIPGPGLAVRSPEPSPREDALARLDKLEKLAHRIRTTYCCNLGPSGTNAVPGEGNPKARLVLVGEGPGATEDQTGRPFVGAAGKLLEEILGAVDLK